MSEPIILVENLVKKYKQLEAVKGISFAVPPGIIFGLLGRNGAGKSTTLEILETLRPKTSGKVRVGAFDLDAEPQRIKEIIGVQLQDSGFYPNLNLREILMLFAGLYNTKVDVMACLEQVGLREKAKAKVKELSGGQRQRFSLATTLINDPQIIFLDEPTTGLDPHSRRHIWEMLRALRERGKTIIITTHYMEEAEYLCDEIAIMNAGRLVAQGSADVLIQELLDSGFVPAVKPKSASLEDVFLHLIQS